MWKVCVVRQQRCWPCNLDAFCIFTIKFSISKRSSLHHLLAACLSPYLNPLSCRASPLTSKIVWCYAPININPGGKGAGNGWGFDNKLKNWVKCRLVGILRRSNVSKQTHPGDRLKQNILIIFNIKSHKKRLGIVNFSPRIRTVYCINSVGSRNRHI